MKKFIFFEITLDGQRKVEPEVVGDTVFVAVGIINIGDSVQIVHRKGVCDWSACLVSDDTGGSDSSAEMVNNNCIKYMWNVVVCRVGKAVIDAVPGLITVHLYN